MKTNKFFEELAEVFGTVADELTLADCGDWDDIEAAVATIVSKSKACPEVQEVAKILAYEVPTHDEKILKEIRYFKRVLKNLSRKLNNLPHNRSSAN